MTAGSDNSFPKLITTVQASDPSAPANGDWKIYSKAAGIYARSSNTVVGPFAGGGYTPGGTDVAIADGGTGQSTATAGFDALSPMTTAGDLIMGGASGTRTRFAAGSNSGYVLTANGAGVAPSWQVAGGGSSGALVLLEQHTASASATLDFTTFISATYDEYQFEIMNIVPGTTSQALWMRMGTGGGPTYDTGANYGWMALVLRAGASAITGAEGGATKIQLGYNTDIPNTANWGVNGSLTLRDPGGALYKWVDGRILYQDGGFRIQNTVSGTYESTTAVTAIRFMFAAGNIASGTIRAYGIAKS